MPNRYEQLSYENGLNNTNNRTRPTPLSTRFFHRAPLVFPHHHQHRIRTPPPLFSSSYLGPLQQHRPRFLSAWDLTPTPNVYRSSRNIAATTPTPTSLPQQHDEGACIFEQLCLLFHHLIGCTYQNCATFLGFLFFFFFSVCEQCTEGSNIDYLPEQTAGGVSTYMQDNL
jgi:hypothetical protein